MKRLTASKIMYRIFQIHHVRKSFRELMKTFLTFLPIKHVGHTEKIYSSLNYTFPSFAKENKIRPINTWQRQVTRARKKVKLNHVHTGNFVNSRNNFITRRGRVYIRETLFLTFASCFVFYFFTHAAGVKYDPRFIYTPP